MRFVDVITTIVILAGAVFLLYRSIWKKNGSCHGCANGACRAPRRETAELVRLGELGRPARNMASVSAASPPRSSRGPGSGPR
jgi:hypothetical protein